uniref:G-protein coupled receptors family 1 profile domain-containing protein n=1 Tax=Romanomermis culicivorax TaxID=13658 RepID=A0A915HGK9_ROMCU
MNDPIKMTLINVSSNFSPIDHRFEMSIDNQENYENQNHDLLPDDMKFGADHVMMIVCYTIAFFISSIGNLIVLLIICRNLCSSRKNHRIHLLLLNLNIADLLVTFYCIPKDIIHSFTVQWLGSDFLCRFSKYMDVFGVYASSNLLICMSIDRFFAIVKPLQNFNAKRRIKVMITVAWVSAALSGLPQSQFLIIFKTTVFTFQKAQHPLIRWYSQCISIHYLYPNNKSISNQILANTIINALEIYILPFTVILFCYISIMVTIVQKDNQIWRETINARSIQFGPCNKDKQCILMQQSALKKLNPFETRSPLNTVSRLSSSANEKHQFVQLRRSSHNNMRRAKSRTLRMTVVVVLTFLVCWTPYFIMVALHFLQNDEQRSRGAVPAILERFLYIFAIFNSCINPYIYGYYSFKLKRELTDLAHFCSRKKRQQTTPTVTTRSMYELSHTTFNNNECTILVDGAGGRTSSYCKGPPKSMMVGQKTSAMTTLGERAETATKNNDARIRSVSMAPQAFILN